jgi:hypothetical protein
MTDVVVAAHPPAGTFSLQAGRRRKTVSPSLLTAFTGRECRQAGLRHTGRYEKDAR